ncbi:ATP-binding cassette domain-containing protein [Candidatus Bathyarchaeota archaeon]|nr:ATP-binding cassette domain-containing protein [Candidatus Bathyarchaeota archaeon]
MSGGEQQRVAVAKALANSPKVVLMDEPTGNLDSKNTTHLMTLINQPNEDNQQTFIIVTHDPQVSKMTSKTFYMEDGLIIRKTKQKTLSQSVKYQKSKINTYLNKLDSLYLMRKIDRKTVFRSPFKIYKKRMVEAEINAISLQLSSRKVFSY